MPRNPRIQVQACGCAACRRSIDREFFAVLEASYTASELDRYYSSGLVARLLFDRAAQYGRVRVGAVA